MVTLNSVSNGISVVFSFLFLHEYVCVHGNTHNAWSAKDGFLISLAIIASLHTEYNWQWWVRGIYYNTYLWVRRKRKHVFLAFTKCTKTYFSIKLLNKSSPILLLHKVFLHKFYQKRKTQTFFYVSLIDYIPMLKFMRRISTHACLVCEIPVFSIPYEFRYIYLYSLLSLFQCIKGKNTQLIKDSIN